MDEKYERAKKKVGEIKGFYCHLISFIVVNVFLAVLNFFTTPGFWWFLFVTFFWGIGLFVHGLSVFMTHGIFSKEWEEKKIKEYMEKEKD
ncbi:MAG: 2TM domain-containing protein [Methanobacterium sp.]|uniref:2TM domain-containing protein n=1 Tax=Methanobacterium sp. TaxID=2164 RepID=UPI003D656854|nr:2TM domain-containing protein [Methanobacterium sp.]